MANNLTKARTVEDLERKYNFAKMLGLSKNVEANANSILKVENELNNILTSIVINLSGVLDSQSDVSLWFYSGAPTTSNLPYTSWNTPDDHDGDIYYDRSTGYVYQFDKNEMWVVNPNPDLVSAMALTNAEIDTSDNERKVFFTTPTTPYSNGDWWIKNDGSLYICQITKSTGTYEEQDFISSNDYTDSVATKIDDVIEVLKGTITLISDSYAKFTDLATGGSTTIAGENITSGNIVSNNYVQNQTGMKIALNDGTIDSKNFKTDTSGNIYLGNGAKIIGGDGMMTIMNVPAKNVSGDYCSIGWWWDEYYGDFYKQGAVFDFYIPNNFTVVSAYITLTHYPIRWIYTSFSSSQPEVYYGYARKLNLYQANNVGNINYTYYVNSDQPIIPDQTSYTLRDSAFGSNGWTPSIPTSSSMISETITSSDIKNYINTGANRLKIMTTENFSSMDAATSYSRTAGMSAYITIIGYSSYS